MLGKNAVVINETQSAVGKHVVFVKHVPHQTQASLHVTALPSQVFPFDSAQSLNAADWQHPFWMSLKVRLLMGKEK